MTGGLLGGDVFRGLAFRVLVFLSLALLPFGLIAVVQTREIAEQAQVNTELSLIGLTEQASATERTIFQEGLGAAQALSAMVNAFGEDAETCSAFLRRYQEASKRYSLVGFLPPNGVMQCASADVNYDFSDFEGFADSVAAPRRNITRVEDGAISGQPVLVLTQPFEDADDAFLEEKKRKESKKTKETKPTKSKKKKGKKKRENNKKGNEEIRKDKKKVK